MIKKLARMINRRLTRDIALYRTMHRDTAKLADYYDAIHDEFLSDYYTSLAEESLIIMQREIKLHNRIAKWIGDAPIMATYN